MTGMRPRARRLTLTILSGQIATGCIAILLTQALLGLEAAKAAAYGAGIAIVPGLYFALRVLATPPGTPPKKILAKFYAGEVGKFVLTAALFFGAVKWFSEQMLPVFLTYVSCLLVYLAAMLKTD